MPTLVSYVSVTSPSTITSALSVYRLGESVSHSLGVFTVSVVSTGVSPSAFSCALISPSAALQPHGAFSVSAIFAAHSAPSFVTFIATLTVAFSALTSGVVTNSSHGAMRARPPTYSATSRNRPPPLYQRVLG